MTQDNNIQQDTPQESSNEYASLEEAVFGSEGSQDNVSSAFTSGEKTEATPAPQEGQPSVENQEVVKQPDNDEKRYQYWQSQADKYKNELAAMQQQQAQMNTQMNNQMAQPAQPVEQGVEQFPDPPAKPQRPRSFNREEAYSDPSSESARYMDELEGWRDDISEYNTLRSQYQTAVMEDKFTQIEEAKKAEARRVDAMRQQAAQQGEIKSHVMGHYGMSDNEAVDFMQKMSDPNSINIDNLVQLYRMSNGNPNQGQVTNPTPSDSFTQTKNAQQVPSPMGVMPSGNTNTDGRTFEDKIMDTMIGNFNSKNPWK